ncbi:MAG TPA: sigma-54 dependent transcriptional regulator, partial [bacterium]|nr:sigma-54 dependent transcriptional regulator [bacterium]
MTGKATAAEAAPPIASPKADRLSALIVEDDEIFRESLGQLVSREGFRIREAMTLKEARQLLSEETFDLVLVDLGLPDGSGIELLRDEQRPVGSEFIVITGNATVESAVAALRDGALDYLTKPHDRARLKSVLANVIRTRRLKDEVSTLRGELRELGRFDRLVGRSSAMQSVYDLISRVSPTDASVLLTGESGTGKELAAETIHHLSRRRDQLFLALNCGAIAKSLIESELFGHEKGSFTGADRSRRGHFEMAQGGTLFLDEITEMPIELQVKLLRVLETMMIVRVGSSTPIPVDVRIIASTNRDPLKAVQDGVLREDLYYRLNVFPIVLPPLRDRGDDIELLAEYFLSEVNAREKTEKYWLADGLGKLRSYPWPGNVRELRNTVERAAILADDGIGADLLPGASIIEGPAPASNGPMLRISVGSSLEEVERRLILATLNELKGDKKQTAETLGISLKTLYNRLNIYEAVNRVLPSSDSTGT